MAIAGGAVVGCGTAVGAGAPGAEVAVGAAGAGEVAVADDPQAANKKSPKIKDVSTKKLGLLKTRYMISTPPNFRAAVLLAFPQY